MFDTAAIAAKSSGWSPVRPRMSRSDRTRSRAVPAARRRDMAPWYASRVAAPARSVGGLRRPRPARFMRDRYGDREVAHLYGFPGGVRRGADCNDLASP